MAVYNKNLANNESLFHRFFEENPTCSKFKDNADARSVFAILSKKINVIEMIKISEFGKPALSVCVNEIENYWDSIANPVMDLTDDFTRTAIGRMIKTILGEYGYKVTIQKDLPKSSKAKYFKSASCYAQTDGRRKLGFVPFGNVMAVGEYDGSMPINLYENWHLKYNITFLDNDEYETTAVRINGQEFPLKTRYPYRSQGNAHLVFWSEDGLWYALTFDGHKGDMFFNDHNPIMDYVILVLNGMEKINESCIGSNCLSIHEIYKIMKEYETMQIKE